MNWSYLCDVDIAPLAAWLAEGDKGWPAPSTPSKPQRVREIPAALLEPIYAGVLESFSWVLAVKAERETGKLPNSISMAPADPMLSRMLPGQSHPMHVDRQRADWITRVHVPIVTNPGCWMAWEEEDQRVHFEAGKAYSFDTTARHAFGNDGESERIHLIFEVLRRD